LVLRWVMPARKIIERNWPAGASDGPAISQSLDRRGLLSALPLLCAAGKLRIRQGEADEEGTMADWTSVRQAWEPRMLSILRIVTGLLYLQHGLNKFFNFPPGAQQRTYDLFTLSPGLAGILETFGGILLIFGLFTRPVAFILSGEMAVAYFWAHQPRAIYPYSNGGGFAVLYCFVFLYLWVAGGGEWSLDRLLRRGTSPTTGNVAGRAA